MGCIFQFYGQVASVAGWGIGGRKSQAKISLSSPNDSKKEKSFRQREQKLSNAFKYMTPQLSCLGKSERLMTADKEIIKMLQISVWTAADH